MSGENMAEQAERRAKVARLREELAVQRGDLTSAPSVTNVDEFAQDLSQVANIRR